jgi:hypothetical protein
MTRRLLFGFAALLWAQPLALPARAYVPPQERIADAVAQVNRAANRHRALQIQVALRLGDSPRPVAVGELLSDPGGLSRLELRSEEGVVERHLLRGGRLSATRDGEPIAAPRPFLPPFFLLQAASGDVLTASLLALKVSAHQISLGYDGVNDCYVLGERATVSEPAAMPSRPALWVDQESLEVVRFDRGDGVRFRLGPSSDFGAVRLPAWIEISAPGAAPARLEIGGGQPVSPPTDAFRSDWLSGP